MAAGFPLAGILGSNPIGLPIQVALGIALPVHAHIGMNGIISDYVPKHLRTGARLGWLGVTGVMLVGFLRMNLEGEGIIENLKSVFRDPPAMQE